MLHKNGAPEENNFNRLDDDSVNLDVEKFLGIVRKSVFWILLIMVVCLSAAYLLVRYTPEKFESKSVLQLDIKSEASVFGFKSFDDDINNISKEIEFLKSNLFLGKVAEEIHHELSIYAIGGLLNSERYRNSSFDVVYEIYDPFYFDRNFEVEILNEEFLKLTYTNLQGTQIETQHKFGDTISDNGFRFIFTPTEYYHPETDNRYYYFRINSTGSQISYLAQNISVQPLDFKAKTITVSFTDNNKYKARDIVTALDTLYLYYAQQEKNKENNQKINFLNDQLKSTETKLNELEDYFENFTISQRTTSLDANLARTIAQLEGLDSQRFIVQKKLSVVNDIYEKVNREEDFLLSAIELSNLPQNITSDVKEYEKLIQEKNALKSSYKPNTFVAQKKEEELRFVAERIQQYIIEYKNSLLLQLTEIGKRKAALEREFTTLPSKKTEYTKTERFYNLYEEFYLTLMKNKAQFELAEAGTTTDYKILSPANLPSKPISPNSPLYFGIGAIFGLILSTLFIGIRYLIHNKLSGQRELELLTRLPILGVIPYFSKEKGGTSRLIIDKHPKSELSEAFRLLRTNMEFLSKVDEKPVICITSSVSGEGKTFVAVNLGGIISLLKNKVIILDLDMRKPRLQKVFYNNVSSVGMSTILIGKTTVMDCVQKTNLENLDYIPSGPIPPNPAELISGEYFQQTIDELKKVYDVILIDTPPVGLVTDGIIALKKASIPLFVVREDFTKKSFIKSINKLIQIHHFHNASFILNSTKGSGGYGYGYDKNSYGYYEEEKEATLFKLKSLFGL